MGMYATSANQLKVEFGKDRFVTFKMHADLGIDLVRWLTNQVKQIEVVSKRAERMEKAAIELPDDDNAGFEKLTSDAAALRDKSDQVQMCVEYIKKGSLGWTDFFEDPEAEARNEPLPFTEANIARLGVFNLTVVINAFNTHYGLIGANQPGESISGGLPAPSLPADRAPGASQSGTENSVQTAS